MVRDGKMSSILLWMFVAVGTVGVLIVGFVPFHLWGTGVETRRAQSALDVEFEASSESGTPPPFVAVSQGDAGASSSETSQPQGDAGASSSETSQPPPVVEGSGLFRLTIPKINHQSIVVAGVHPTDLKSGPGHYPLSPMPGQMGLAAVAGHRSTYGAPFSTINELEAGDQIQTTYADGRTYIFEVYANKIVSPSDSAAINSTDLSSSRIVLSTCHPKYSTRQRFVVYAELNTEASPEPLPSVRYELVDEVGVPVDSSPTEPSDVVGDDGANAGVEVGGDPFAGGWFDDRAATRRAALWLGLVFGFGAAGIWLARNVGKLWGAMAVAPVACSVWYLYSAMELVVPAGL